MYPHWDWLSNIFTHTNDNRIGQKSQLIVHRIKHISTVHWSTLEVMQLKVEIIFS